MRILEKYKESNEKIIVGVNKFTQKEADPQPVFKIDDSIRKIQMQKLDQLKSERNSAEVADNLKRLSDAAVGTENLMPYIIACVESYATLGEIADVLRNVFGEYKG
jgi:methylmalonyl-CoA mutase N-terminal domain/subunit